MGCTEGRDSIEIPYKVQSNSDSHMVGSETEAPHPRSTPAHHNTNEVLKSLFDMAITPGLLLEVHYSDV